MSRLSSPGRCVRFTVAAALLALAASAARAEVSASADKGNHLAAEKSPYLQEHAHDPVAWYSWGAEAFDRARRENKLIFLSVGYSSCHWCHVMQQEDFENAQVAGLLNQSFISILVDREERPEVDQQYMAVCEMLTGAGGWPLTVIMTPDREPFFASPYIPRESSGGKEGMLDLLPRIVRLWQSHPEKTRQEGAKLSRLLASTLVREAPGDAITADTLKAAREQLGETFDPRHGGFGAGPKFPPALSLFFLLRYWKRTGDAKALAMVTDTLDAMRAGGIFDQVGWGVHRYTADPEWHAPHFEKMLYDQALVAMAYAEAFQATHEERFAQTAREICDYVLRDLRAPEGGFYDSEDADVDGHEGAFYLWTDDEIRQVLGESEAEFVLKILDIRKGGNLPGGEAGENVLYFRAPLAHLPAVLKISPEELAERWEAGREKLFLARQARAHPRQDTKVLAAWNGLMIAALAKTAQALGDAQHPEYLQAAERAADFALQHLRTKDGRLLRSYAGSEASLPGTLDDYAFLTWGVTELYETDFEVRYLQAALDLNHIMLEHFWDAAKGGFYFTADDDSNHLVREKCLDDADLPSGNSVAILNLARLAELTGDAALAGKADATERAFAGLIQKAPTNYAEALTATDFVLGPVYEVVVAGNSRAPETRAMLAAAERPFLPGKVVLLRPTEAASPEIVRLAGYTRFQQGVDGKPTAYVCVKYSCRLPTTDTRKMLDLLGAP
jgi:uncharacterized protein